MSPKIRAGTTIRPTSDRAREALFSIIGAAVTEAVVLDFFAGTGALGLEALSRGARSAVFVDNHRKATELIQKNIVLCGFSERSIVIKKDLTKGLSFLGKMLPVDGFILVFLDPPYRMKLGQLLLTELGNTINLTGSRCLVIAEDEAAEDLPTQAGSLTLCDQRRYGETGFWLYRG